ncbi:MAG TPA: NnrS family protein, partial [Burkholderiaceae bacterium]|nr:NnrS family protein [Burkholderiaceae bacterium]
VLHLAYIWVPVHFALRALAALGAVPSSSATHALTVGAIGGLIIGMMTRTARGHTARPLRADRADTTCYVLVLLAGVARVAVPLVAPEQTLLAVQWSAALWSAGFGLYAARYGPVLTRARLDGKPG